MVELSSLSPCSELALPISRGQAQLHEVDLGPLASLAPYKDQQKALSEVLKKAHGLGYPAPYEVLVNDAVRILWFGRDMALIVGVRPDPKLHAMAAITDQSVAWVAVELSGKGSVDVLARLVPVDMRASVLHQGSTVRTLLGHMSASITPTGNDTYLILVFRSMAETLVHELQEAMEAVAWRS